MRTRSTIFQISLALCAATLFSSVVASENAAPSPESMANSLLQPLVADQKIVGVCVGIHVNGEDFIKGYGRVKLDSDAPPDAESVYELASISKVFTGVLLAQMAMSGDVSLEQPVRELLPDTLIVPTFEGNEVQLHHLSSQNSGLPRMPANFQPADDKNPYADYTVEKMYEFLGQCTLKTRPGEKYAYSNLGVGLLGHALARKAGKSYEELLVERVCGPLEMNATRVVFTPEMLAHEAPPHDKNRALTSHWDIPTFAGAGGIRSSVGDMMKFARANLGDPPSPLTPFMEESHKERIRVNENLGVGLGWHLSYFKELDEPIVWHNGETGGFRTFFGLLKNRKIAVVLLCNTRFSMDEPGFEMLKRLGVAK